MWSRNRQNSCLFNLPSYRLRNALQYQASWLLFANFKKQRRKANASSVRRPHCSHVLCAWICEFDGHLSNDTLQWHMHSFWKSHRRSIAAACLTKCVTEKDRCFLSWFILMFYRSNNVRYHRDTDFFLIYPYCCIHTRFSLWYKNCLWFRWSEKL